MTHPPLSAVTRPSAVASPRLLAQIAGVYHLLIFIVAPSGAATATPLRMVASVDYFGALGEGLLTLWLLIRGVDRERWTQQAHV